MSIPQWAYDALLALARSSPVVQLYKSVTECKSDMVALLEILARLASDKKYSEKLERLLIDYAAESLSMVLGNEIRKIAARRKLERAQAATAIPKVELE